MSRYCLYCGKEITRLHANAKYCPECRKFATRQKRGNTKEKLAREKRI